MKYLEGLGQEIRLRREEEEEGEMKPFGVIYCRPVFACLAGMAGDAGLLDRIDLAGLSFFFCSDSRIDLLKLVAKPFAMGTPTEGRLEIPT